MDYSTGKLSVILMVAVLLAALGAWIIAARYRAALRRLMSEEGAATPAATGVMPLTPQPAPPRGRR